MKSFLRVLQFFRSGSGRGATQPAVITDAQESPAQERFRREKIYGFLMFLRVPSLLLTVWLIYAYQAWVPAAIISALTIPLPWLAVMFANARGPKKDKRQPVIYKPGLARQQANYFSDRRSLESPTASSQGARFYHPIIDYISADNEDNPGGEDSNDDK
ncbi:MAG: DUF3099 domain-containing protein [Corynebacterium sp.]|nr:DUF3099 domain-containing protein [Corynebacterium sp.]